MGLTNQNGSACRRRTRMVQWRVRVVVVIADIVASREIEDRRRFQRGLATSLDATSRRAAGALLSPYTITLGDEFQAVYGSAGAIIRDLVFILASIHPARARVALAHGELTTDVNPAAALGMDGPAFATARAAMDELKEHDRTRIRLASTELASCELVNVALAMLANAANDWRGTTIATLDALLDGASADEIAARLFVTPRAIYKQIATHNLVDFARLCRIVDAELRSGLTLGGGEGC